MLGLFNARRHDCCDVVVSHGLVGVCEDDLTVLWMLYYTGLEV